jgi:DNA-binding NtrC family response regulator
MNRNGHRHGINREALDKLSDPDVRWPGNVRDLRNLMQKTCAAAVGRPIAARDVDLAEQSAVPIQSAMRPWCADAPLNQPLDETLNDVKRHVILKVGELNSWKKSRTADALGMRRQTLADWIIDLKIVDRFSDADNH